MLREKSNTLSIIFSFSCLSKFFPFQMSICLLIKSNQPNFPVKSRNVEVKCVVVYLVLLRHLKYFHYLAYIRADRQISECQFIYYWMHWMYSFSVSKCPSICLSYFSTHLLTYCLGTSTITHMVQNMSTSISSSVNVV